MDTDAFPKRHIKAIADTEGIELAYVGDKNEGGAKGREYVLKNQSYSILAEKFVDAVKNRNEDTCF